MFARSFFPAQETSWSEKFHTVLLWRNFEHDWLLLSRENLKLRNSLSETLHGTLDSYKLVPRISHFPSLGGERRDPGNDVGTATSSVRNVLVPFPNVSHAYWRGEHVTSDFSFSETTMWSVVMLAVLRKKLRGPAQWVSNVYFTSNLIIILYLL